MTTMVWDSIVHLDVYLDASRSHWMAPGLWDWAITTDLSNSLSFSRKTSVVFPWKPQHSPLSPPLHPVCSNGWQPSVRRRTFWCLFEIFFSLIWVNTLWFFLKCSVQKKFPMIWQTIPLIFWTTLSGQPCYVFLPGSSTPISPTSPHIPTLSTPAPFD